MSKQSSPLTFTSLGLCLALLSACLPKNQPVTEPSNSLELFPKINEGSPSYSVAEYMLTLPQSELGEISNRANFAKWMLKEGSPQPIADGQRYLFLRGTALDPKRHYFLFDQRHLLIYHEYMDLEYGYPAELKILRREGDIQWRDVTQTAAPAWTHSPLEVEFLQPESPQAQIRIEATHAAKRKQETFQWQEGKLQAVTSSTSS